MHHAGRAFIHLARRQCKIVPTTMRRTMSASSRQEGLTKNLNDDTWPGQKKRDILSEKIDDPKDLEQIEELKNIRDLFSTYTLGTRSGVVRDQMVLQMAKLSNSVMQGQYKALDLMSTPTFKFFEEKIETNIAHLSNNQVVKLLYSLIRMQIDRDSHLRVVLEKELDYRMHTLNFNHTMKLINVYESYAMDPNTQSLVGSLKERMKHYIHDDANDLGELIGTLNLASQNKAPPLMVNLINEKLLNLLGEDITKDDMVTPFLVNYSSHSLCELLISLARYRIRPKPLISLTSNHLAFLLNKINHEKPSAKMIIETLNSLILLSYPRKRLISNLVQVLVKSGELSRLDADFQIKFLRCMSSLRWKNEEAMDILFKHAEQVKHLEPDLVIGLLHVSSLVNYGSTERVEKFLKKISEESDGVKRFDAKCLKPRQLLNYIWSLEVLRLSDKSKIKLVLSDKFYEKLSQQSSPFQIRYSDAMKLLNLRALAKYEYNIKNLAGDHLKTMANLEIQRSMDVVKFSAKIRDTLRDSIASRAEQLRHNIKTPFGFTIDCEMHFNQKLEPIFLDREIDFLFTGDEPDGQLMINKAEDGRNRCAFICLSYEDCIANSDNEMVGHNLIIERILSQLGYVSIFLKSYLNNERMSANLSDNLRETIREKLGLVSGKQGNVNDLDRSNLLKK